MVWCGSSEALSRGTFSVRSPDTDFGNGMKARIIVKRRTETATAAANTDADADADANAECDDIGCFLHLDGYGGPADFKVTFFPHRGDSPVSTAAVCTYFLRGECIFGDQCRNAHPLQCASKQSLCEWAVGKGHGWLSFMTSEDFTSKHYVKDDKVCVMVTVHLKR